MFRITNYHGTVIWEGYAKSFGAAWHEMFDACKYSMTERSISKEIDRGMWIEKI